MMLCGLLAGVCCLWGGQGVVRWLFVFCLSVFVRGCCKGVLSLLSDDRFRKYMSPTAPASGVSLHMCMLHALPTLAVLVTP